MLFCKNIEYICTHHRKGLCCSTPWFERTKQP